MTAQIIVLSDYRKAKAEAKELTYAEWLRFCMDPFGFMDLAKLQTRNRTEGDEQ